MKDNPHHLYNSISEFHASLRLKKPTHPLVSIIRLDDIKAAGGGDVHSITHNFYTVFLTKNFDGKIRYGQQYYDFDSGTMAFYAPKQRVTFEDYTPAKLEGWVLAFHPDFAQGNPLVKKIKDYGFFSYAANEALHLSEKEETVISGLMQNLQSEIEAMIDAYTQDVVISHIDLLLNYCNRFYNRQLLQERKHQTICL